MFDDIRPYRDEEVAEVLGKLIIDPEFLGSIAQYVFPRMNRLSPSFTKTLVKWSLKSRCKHIDNVQSFQYEIETYMNRLIRKSTSGFSHSGLDKLDLKKPTLFISNHRDIVLDPALVNMALHTSGENTVEIAIGDNLLSKPWISDLMRLNKSFIVKRSETTKRAMLMASKNLSAYIHHALNDIKEHVWIAQREGRAKDGIDQTNSALISMILLNKGKQRSIEQYLDELNIVPVSISYELDPCDADKAKELATIEETGEYQKQEHEDVRSITQGITGFKGQVHVAFGEPLKGDYEDSKAIAAEIDRQILQNYRLYDSNKAAHAILTSDNSVANEKSIKDFEQRLIGLSPNQQQFLIKMYANPVLAK